MNIIFYSNNLPQWTSCKSISTNLKQAHKLAFPSSLFFEINTGIMRQRNSFQSVLYLNSLCKKISSIKNVTALIFFEWEPLQLDLIDAIRTHPFTNEKKYYFIVHTYADLVLFSNLWLKISEKLIGEKVKLLLASEREAKVAKKLLAKSKGIVEYCPFPVDVDFFSFDPALRKNIRHRLGLNDDDRLIIYTGRISLQKNVDILIKQFEKISNMCTKNVFLYIVGSYDDYGADVLGLYTPLGWYYNKIDGLMSQLPKNISSKIKILNFQTPLEIKGLLNASDLFWSLSLHHNEDFGMSVAEALSCGLPCVVTNWAGYSSFSKENANCKLIRITHKSTGKYSFAESQFLHKSLSFLEQSPRHSQLRSKKIQSFNSLFSIIAISKKLDTIKLKKANSFRGFKLHAFTLKERIYSTKISEDDLFYRKIYSPYYTRL